MLVHEITFILEGSKSLSLLVGVSKPIYFIVTSFIILILYLTDNIIVIDPSHKY